MPGSRPCWPGTSEAAPIQSSALNPPPSRSQYLLAEIAREILGHCHETMRFPFRSVAVACDSRPFAVGGHPVEYRHWPATLRRRYRRRQGRLPAATAAAGGERGACRTRAAVVLGSARVSVRPHRLRQLPPAAARLGRERSAQPQQFRQADLAQITDAARRRPPRFRSQRLGRSQCQPRSPGQGVDRNRVDVDAGDRHAR